MIIVQEEPLVLKYLRLKGIDKEIKCPLCGNNNFEYSENAELTAQACSSKDKMKSFLNTACKLNFFYLLTCQSCANSLFFSASYIEKFLSENGISIKKLPNLSIQQRD